ncbi:MAG: hypothetical protein ACI9LM_000115 [Alteromonadaceae bacterium]|jgi:hypothetical protein
MKTDNPSLGNIICHGCECQADIKQKKTGKKLLYLHCKNCGLDQRSGNFLQLKWQHAIDGVSETDTEELTEITTEIISEVTSETVSEITPKLTEKEWQPVSNGATKNDELSETARPESERKDETSKGNSWGGWIATAIGVGLVIARVRS